MKKLTFSILLAGLFANLFAQAPQKLNYQGVARNANGTVMANQAVSVRLTVLDGSASGTSVYSETHTAITNGVGLFTLPLGGGTVVSGNFGTINWLSNAKFLKTELDPAGGSNFLTMGTSQFLSVPYALAANVANSLATPPSLTLDDLTNVNAPAPAMGQVLQWNGANWAPATVSGSGDNWGTQTAVTGTALTGNGTAVSPLTLAQQGATSGQVLKWNGTAWAPAADAGTSYTAGTGITIAGTTINSYWTFAANNLYNNNSGVVGIGTTTPAATSKLSVNSALLNSGVFTNTGASSATSDPSALVGQYTATTATDGVGVLGISIPQDNYGYGGQFLGGYIGSIGAVQNALNSSYYGAAGLITPSTGGTGTYIGVVGNSTAEAGIGLAGNFYAQGDGTSGVAIGVLGEADVTTGPTLTTITDLGMPGGYFTSNSGRGSFSENTGTFTVGTSLIGVGAMGHSVPGSSSFSIGLMGQGEMGTNSSTGAELYGVSTGGTYGLGLYATASGGTTNYAAYLDGDVAVSGNLSKAGGTFKIDHPQDPANKYLIHSFVESPDMMNIYNGNITTDANGLATVTLPAYFEALNMDFRYQLTPIGTFAQAIISTEIQGNQFVIQTDKPNVKVSWQVTGVRQDAWANANRVLPEIEKQGTEKGRYLHPELFGADRSASIGELHSSVKGELKNSKPQSLNIPKGLPKDLKPAQK